MSQVFVCVTCGMEYEDPTEHDVHYHLDEPTQREWVEAVSTIMRAAKCESFLPNARAAAQAFLEKYETPAQ